MNGFAIHTPETAPAASRPVLEGIRKAWGFIPNLHAGLAEAPTALTAYNQLFDLVGQGTLTSGEQQVVFMTANVLHECEYCASGHSMLAAKAGLDAATVDALREGRTLADPRLQMLREFTATLVLARGRVQPGQLAEFLAAGFTRAQVLEILVALAAKTISNYANHILGTPLDAFMAPTAWVAPSRRQHADGGAGATARAA